MSLKDKQIYLIDFITSYDDEGIMEHIKTFNAKLNQYKMLLSHKETPQKITNTVRIHVETKDLSVFQRTATDY